MRSILAVFFVCIAMSSYTQETKFIIKKHGNSLFEEYYVLKSNTKTKHGKYFMYSASNFGSGGIYLNKREIQIIETGTFNNGKKEGTWITYDGNKMSSVHNYKSDSLEGECYYFWPDSLGSKSYVMDQARSGNDSLLINEPHDSLLVHIHGFFRNNKECSVWSYYDRANGLYFQYDYDRKFLIKDKSSNSENLDIFHSPEIKQPIFIEGGIIEFHNEFKSLVAYMPFRKSTKVIIKFHINSEGRITSGDFINFPFSKGKIKKLEEEIKSLPVKCIPKKIDNIFVESEITLEYDINVKDGKVTVSGCQAI